jgi:hypothetical protein
LRWLLVLLAVPGSLIIVPIVDVIAVSLRTVRGSRLTSRMPQRRVLCGERFVDRMRSPKAGATS